MGYPWAGMLGQGGCCTSSYSERVALGGAVQRWCVGCRMLGLCVQGVGAGAVTPVGGGGVLWEEVRCLGEGRGGGRRGERAA